MAPSSTKSTSWIRTSSSLNRPALHIRSKSSPPDAYSITIARCVGVNMTYSHMIMLLDFRIVPTEKNMIKHQDPTDLFESDNVGMPQWLVVYNFPLYILIYLLTQYKCWVNNNTKQGSTKAREVQDVMHDKSLSFQSILRWSVAYTKVTDSEFQPAV